MSSSSKRFLKDFCRRGISLLLLFSMMFSLMGASGIVDTDPAQTPAPAATMAPAEGDTAEEMQPEQEEGGNVQDSDAQESPTPSPSVAPEEQKEQSSENEPGGGSDTVEEDAQAPSHETLDEEPVAEDDDSEPVTPAAEKAEQDAEVLDADAVKLAAGKETTIQVSGDEDHKFDFVVYTYGDNGEIIPCADMGFALYTQSAGMWKYSLTDNHTDENGLIALASGQKIVFKNSTGKDVYVKLAETLFWSSAVSAAENGENEYVFSVTQAPILYVSKRLSSVPEGTDVSGLRFKIQVKRNGVPAANVPFWFVSDVPEEGKDPVRIEGKEQGMTDSEGFLTLVVDDTVALFQVGKAGDTYTLYEEDNGGDWVCEENNKTGTLDGARAVETVTDCYKWKDLYITKYVLHEDVNLTKNDEFTFRVVHLGGSDGSTPVSGKTWTLETEMDGEEIASGTLDEDGTFTCHATQGVVKISGLEAAERYNVAEIIPENSKYVDLNGSNVNVKMPTDYSSYAEVTVLSNCEEEEAEGLAGESAEKKTETTTQAAQQTASIAALPATVSLTVLSSSEDDDFKTVRIDKTAEGYSIDVFTIVLREITEGEVNITASNYPATIRKTIAAKGVEYTVYDAETENAVGTYKTDSNGYIFLKGGQYAELKLPLEHRYTVHEKETPNFTLKSMAVESGDTPLTKLADNLTLVDTTSPYHVKYAVAIYGIKQDKTSDGKIANVTFGPATGENYVNGYKACEGTSAEDPGDCFHWKSWKEIIRIAQEDPESLEPCLKNGCTHSVLLNFQEGSVIKGDSYYGQMPGDGASILQRSIGREYIRWNLGYCTYGGWAASRVRAMLNGADKYTADGTDVDTMDGRLYYPDGDTKVEAGANMDGFAAEQALISAFPAELQTAIVPKAVVADTKWDDTSTTDYTATTYDKLWCFSGTEIYQQDPSGDNDGIRPNEGLAGETKYYARTGEMGITTSTYSMNAGFAEDGSEYAWWLRAIQDSGCSFCVYLGGEPWPSSITASGRLAVSPGFCLGSSEPPVVLGPSPCGDDYDVKYAVSIYGIKQDYDKDGNTLALTFGPATGEDYTHSYKYCPGTDASINPGNCMHWMTWDEIVEKAQTDPELFRDCLENGCTHSVGIKFDDTTIKGTSYNGQMDDGDGASALYDALGYSYRKWNDLNFTYGGWPGSRIRAVLNGSDEYTADGTNVDNMGGVIYYSKDADTKNAGTDMEGFAESQALISAFPAALQGAIAQKAVVSDTYSGESDTTEYTATTNDKLWYFSGTEVYKKVSSGNPSIHKNEALSGDTDHYARAEALGITTSSYSLNQAFRETGNGCSWEFRTASNVATNVFLVYAYTGNTGYGSVNASSGIAPGFCIGVLPREYDVKYAVAIYGIRQDKDAYGNDIGLTFGPATGEDYTSSFKACSGTSASEPGDCIHWKSWDDIIEIANTNPELFEPCLENGCTHSVELAFSNTTILGTSYKHQMDGGDGASVLYDSIGTDYRKWDTTNNAYGGWPASRARAVLNGTDEYTADGSSVNDMDSRIYYPDGDIKNEAGADMDGFTRKAALISAFPVEMQTAIVPKAVVSDTKPNDYETTEYTVTTYDKLWYFASAEIYQEDPSDSDDRIRPNEGLSERMKYYGRTEKFGTTALTGSPNFTEDGSTPNAWWLRSIKRDSTIYVDCADSATPSLTRRMCLAPGFGIGTPLNDAKYAVSIYGIKQDKTLDGNIANVTFGPATGADYRHDYVACAGTSEKNPGNCMHWMTWEEISDKAQNDPESFQACLENGCTHAVDIKFADTTIRGESYGGQMNDGDGSSTLARSIGTNYRKWNNTKYNYGGWPSSRIRATLNGADEYTADGTDVSNMDGKLYSITSTSDYAGTDMDGFTAEQALISAFPAELRDAIVPKAVASETNYNDYKTTNYTATTYDKLWLFSGAEVYQESSDTLKNAVIRPSEGLDGDVKFYDRAEKFNITTASNDARYRNAAYSESGAAYWWLRSPRRASYDLAYYVSYDGGWSNMDLNGTNISISPGFCLGTSAGAVYGPSPCEDDYDVKYAVAIYGIKQDTGQYGEPLALTFGPATGEDYTHSYKYCPGTDANVNPGNCMHWMTWDEIIEKAHTDPESFCGCLENGCTHSVGIKFATFIKGTSYAGQMDDGDGASMLYHSISEDYLKWNNTSDNSGGWAASRIRAMLNGSDAYTAAGGPGVDTMGGILYNITSTSNYAGNDMDGFPSRFALIYSFPTELQEAIMPKAVSTDTKWDDNATNDYTATTYDKLWLFSGAEIYQIDPDAQEKAPGYSGVQLNDVVRQNEGLVVDTEYYGRTGEMGITTSAYSMNAGFRETGDNYAWWLRSLGAHNDDACFVMHPGVGMPGEVTVDNSLGISPGFCIRYYDKNLIYNAPSPCICNYDVKYAVSIYGINQDVGQSGNTLALTFGPATGADYTHNYKYCPGTDTSYHGNCMHWMTWDRIIEVAKTNPESLRPCLENGCTHSVALKFTDRTIKGTSYARRMYDGDGASILYDSIGQDYIWWNNVNANFGGWAASRARAVLNGADKYTADGENVDDMGGKLLITSTANYAGTDMNGFTVEQALISAFPTELQNAIVPKTVVADTEWLTPPGYDCVATTYDKLWYFSGAEVYQEDPSASNEIILAVEGLTGKTKYYDRTGKMGITTSTYSRNAGFNETGSAFYWWLRSISHSYDDGVFGIVPKGSWWPLYPYYREQSDPGGLAPGFCID